jgi:hypothetical protein
VEGISGACGLSWAYEGFVCGWPTGDVGAKDECFSVAAAWTFSNKAYGTHARLVYDQKISGFQELGDLVEDEV